jgi:hypothetical protein
VKLRLAAVIPLEARREATETVVAVILEALRELAVALVAVKSVATTDPEV